MSDEELQQHRLLQLFELAMKHVKDRDILKTEALFNAFRELMECGYAEHILTIAHYLLEVGDLEQPMRFVEAVKTVVNDPLGDQIMTMAQRLQQEGRQEEKIQVAKKLLKLGLSKEQIMEATGLSLAELEQLYS